jgi:transposase
VESTGCYHYGLTETTYAVGLLCLVCNPIITKQQIRATIRGKKTDRTDALIVARLGLRGEGRPYTPEPYRSAKHLARSVQKLSIFGDAFSSHHKHLVALTEVSLSTETQELMLAVRTAINDAWAQLYQELTNSAAGDSFRQLQTIKGIGLYVAASIIGEVQDIRHFTSAKALVAFTGLDPKVRQSGKALNSTGRLTKRGSTYLRRSIFIAASVARQHDPQFKELYDKKRAEGKTYTVVTIAVARKLLAVVRSVWLSGKPYALPEKFRVDRDI